MSKHAKLSPSGAHRWMNCPGSVEAEASYPDTSSSFADEGTLAHFLAEVSLTNGLDAKAAAETSEFAYNEHYEAHFDDSMIDYVQTYVDYVRAIGGKQYYEKKYSLGHLIPQSFGTADVVALNGSHAHVIDLKYGKGVPVDAENNPQLMLYALGVYEHFAWMEPIERITLCVHMPRLDHVTEWEIEATELLAWGQEARQKANDALLPNAERVPGASQCRWCKAAGACRAYADFNMEIILGDFDDLTVTAALSEELRDPFKLASDEVADILEAAPGVTSWIEKVRSEAHNRFETANGIPRHKIVEGRSIRKWADEDAVFERMKKTKYRLEEFAPRKVKTVAQMEKLLGKGHRVLEEHAVKPDGKPTLVPADDKRPAISIRATEGFENLETEKQENVT